MLKGLTIKNYRIFEEFELPNLGRVNLIVGMNNSGKSTLLEAIHLLTSDDVRASLLHIMDERGEFVSGTNDFDVRRARLGGYQTSQIFHARLVDPDNLVSISSTRGTNITLEIAVQEGNIRKGVRVQQQTLFNDSEEDVSLDSQRRERYMVLRRKVDNQNVLEEGVPITDDGLIFVEDIRFRTRVGRRPQYDQARSRLVTTNYLGYDDLATLWDRITLTPKEDKVVESLQILDPRVERISFTSSRTSNSGILLKLRTETEPVPLGSMGDGMRRILAISASLVSVDDGTLLVDEIDTGLHYGALRDMWRLVIETAVRQRAQVFATTHSWDCVRAFQMALKDTKPEYGSLIRLETGTEGVTSVEYSASELEIAVEQGIEVR